MQKALWLKIVNPILMLAVIIQASTGYLSENRHWVKEIHETNAVIVLALAAIHLYLNWSWVKSNFLNKFSHAPKA
ncbi:MAG: DUF4405 domain-containing protein [Pseudomonadota bacterium]